METRIDLHLADSNAPPLGIRLDGPVDNPRKVIDVNAIQQYLVSRGLGRALKGKDGGNLIEGLLGGRKQGQAPGGQPPAEGQEQQPKPGGKQLLQDLLKGLGGR